MSVSVNTTEAIRAIDATQEVVGCSDKALMSYGAGIMMNETHRAFAAGVDPSTNRPWPTRKGSYSWPMLQRTGTLRGALTTGWGLKTKSGRPAFFGKVREAQYISMFNLAGGKRRHTPMALVAMAVYYGRKNGDRGHTPPRPFFGWSNSASRRFSERAERLINKINQSGGRR